MDIRTVQIFFLFLDDYTLSHIHLAPILTGSFPINKPNRGHKLQNAP